MVYRYEDISEKIKGAYRSGGISTLFVRTFYLTLETLFKFHTSYWYVKDLSEPFENHVPKLKVNINYAPIEETIDWEKENLLHGNFTLEVKQEINIAYENNHKYIQICYGKKIIGFLKIGFHKVYIKEYVKNILIPQNTVFIYDTFVSEDYRGLGIAPYMINEVMRNLSKQGLEFVVCHILPTNVASQNAYSKVGFNRIKYICHLRLFGLRLFNCDPEKLMKKLLSK